MLFLWIFGGPVEDRLGHFGFLVFYLSCGLLAGAAQVLAAPTSPIPMVGASGAIAGVLGAYFMLFPRSRVLTLLLLPFLVRVVYIPAVFFLGAWFLMQLLSLPQGANGGVAFAAHVGGFIAGLLLVRLFGALHRSVPDAAGASKRSSLSELRENGPCRVLIEGHGGELLALGNRGEGLAQHLAEGAAVFHELASRARLIEAV